MVKGIIWGAFFVLCMLGIGTLGVWGFSDATNKVIAGILCGVVFLATIYLIASSWPRYYWLTAKDCRFRVMMAGFLALNALVQMIRLPERDFFWWWKLGFFLLMAVAGSVFFSMYLKRRGMIGCPACGRMKPEPPPGQYECSQCGHRFRVDNGKPKSLL